MPYADMSRVSNKFQILVCLKVYFLQVQSPRASAGRRRRNVSLIQVDRQGISVLGAAALAEQPSAVELLGEFVS